MPLLVCGPSLDSQGWHLQEHSTEQDLNNEKSAISRCKGGVFQKTGPACAKDLQQEEAGHKGEPKIRLPG